MYFVIYVVVSFFGYVVYLVYLFLSSSLYFPRLLFLYFVSYFVRYCFIYVLIYVVCYFVIS